MVHFRMGEHSANESSVYIHTADNMTLIAGFVIKVVRCSKCNVEWIYKSLQMIFQL